MTYEEVVEKAVAAAKKRIGGDEHIAVQFNIIGEGEGIFYVETKDKLLDVQPYEYYDRDVLVKADANTILRIIEGNEYLADLFTAEKAYGDPLKARFFDQMKKKGTRSRKKGTRSRKKPTAATA